MTDATPAAVPSSGAEPRHLTWDAAVEECARVLRPSGAFVVVDGLGASGKSTFATAVAERFRNQAGDPAAGVHVVHTDDFTRPGTTQWEFDRFVEQVLLPLSQGRAARYRRWHWTDAEPGAWVDVPAGSSLVLEGIAASDLRAPRDLTLWIDADAATRTRRAERRNPARFACWDGTWRPIEDDWFARTRPDRRANVVVEAGAALDPR